MSRKWSRTIERNQKTVNRLRAKQGKQTVTVGGFAAMTAYRGRSWSWALFMIGFGIVCMTYFRNLYGGDPLYFYTGIAYIVVGLMFYFFRRPVLRVGKSELSSRRFSGDVTVSASQVESISLEPGVVIIELKNKRFRWYFSRFLHWMPMEEMSAALRRFAAENRVKLMDRTTSGKETSTDKETSTGKGTAPGKATTIGKEKE